MVSLICNYHVSHKYTNISVNIDASFNNRNYFNQKGKTLTFRLASHQCMSVFICFLMFFFLLHIFMRLYHVSRRCEKSLPFSLLVRPRVHCLFPRVIAVHESTNIVHFHVHPLTFMGPLPHIDGWKDILECQTY